MISEKANVIKQHIFIQGDVSCCDLARLLERVFGKSAKNENVKNEIIVHVGRLISDKDAIDTELFDRLGIFDLERHNMKRDIGIFDM